MPGQQRFRESELAGERGNHGRALTAERRQGAGGPAQLGGQACPGAPDLVVSRLDTCQPAGGLQSERHREGLLKQSAPGHERIPVGASQAGAPRPRRVRSASISGTARWATSIAPESRMSWLVAPQCTQVRAGAAPGARAATSGMTGCRPDGRPTQAGRVEALRRQAPAMISAAAAGSRPHPLPPGQRGFGVQERLQPRSIAGGVDQLV